MQSLLADPALCGWPTELITVIANPMSAADLADRVADVAEATTGVLLLYYVGHGLLSTRGELCLTVTSTRPNRPKITGLHWETLAEVLRTCPARIRLAILDCCFAGQAIEALSADDGEGLADITHVGGVYTLTATTRNRTAHVPPADQQDTACTSFTGELQDLIRSGIPGKPSQLTFSDIYPELRQRLRAKGLPAPSQRGTDTAHQFPFAANIIVARTEPAAQIIQPRGDGNEDRDTTLTHHEPVQVSRPQQARVLTNEDRDTTLTNHEPVQVNRSQQSRILTNALHVAWSITDQRWKAQILAEIARAAAAADPGRAARLIDDAERIAQSLTDGRPKASALAAIARAAAAADPGRAARLIDDAERIAQSIPDQDPKASALAEIAQAAAAADPGRAARLIDDAERIAGSITDEYLKALALAEIVRAAAAADPGRASPAHRPRRAHRPVPHRRHPDLGPGRDRASCGGRRPRLRRTHRPVPHRRAS